MSQRAMMIQAQQAFYDQMRWELEAMDMDGPHCQRQKDYAFGLIDEYGSRATARKPPNDKLEQLGLDHGCRLAALGDHSGFPPSF